jgi:hypothetical protein
MAEMQILQEKKSAQYYGILPKLAIYAHPLEKVKISNS